MKILPALLFVSTLASAQAPAPFAAGESIEYDIAWRVFGAGKAKMTLAETPAHQWKATVEADSSAIISKLYKVEDVFLHMENNEKDMMLD